MGARTDERWVKRVKQLHVQEPKWSGQTIAEKLELEGDGSPSGRQVRRILKKWIPNDDERLSYALFSWPESMESGVLPWEASRELLDLQKRLQILGELTNSFAVWYWRVSQAMPDATQSERRTVAGLLNAWGDSRPAEAQSLRTFLMYAAWRPEALQEYEKVVHVRDRFDWGLHNVENVGEAMNKLQGVHNPSRARYLNKTHMAGQRGGRKPTTTQAREGEKNE